MKTLKYSLVLLFIPFICFSQNFRETLASIDVQHYKLSIEVNDTNNRIEASMDISLKLKKKLPQITLDFVSLDSLGLGMNVLSIFKKGDSIKYSHLNNELFIDTDSIYSDSIQTYTINYGGIPKDGLIIGANKYGDKTFFGDNWPNRAHHWFPCIDHPSDKATIEYFVTAPNEYQVIANGEAIEETNIDSTKKLYHFKTKEAIPTKVMVIGIAKFAVENLGIYNNIPVSTWVYPQTKKEGFYDFETAPAILQFYSEKIGSYPFEKLANVQSSTRYGGMENAGNIFYFENSVNGKREHINIIAHEIAHQWFGNSISEINWPHIWLSEGFATYFENLYMKHAFGEQVFQQILKDEKTKVIEFHKAQKTPVIDKTRTHLMELLNPNSYEKGGWILYMLHNKLGDEIFWEGIRAYYKKYKFINASTNSFKNTMSKVANTNLDQFFKQWLEEPGHPILKISWISYKDKLGIILDQTQENPFVFDLDVEIIYENGTSEIKTIKVNNKYDPYELPTTGNVSKINLDPSNKLLFELIEN